MKLKKTLTPNLQVEIVRQTNGAQETVVLQR